MILFHGTIEENLKSIKKQGILDATKDQWLTEITKQQVCCLGSQPTAGEGGNPAYFAYGNQKAKNQNGYLTVIDVPLEFLEKKVLIILDNKILDDYVRYHFFQREEFSQVGYALWEKIQAYKATKDRYLRSLEKYLEVRPANKEDKIIHAPRDQRIYYKKVFDKRDRKMYSLLDIEFSDELYTLIEKIGKWEPFYEFLRHHFETITPKAYKAFQKEHRGNALNKYWKKFYTLFPLKPSEEKYTYLENWFSPLWLSSRTMREVSKNCQILSHKVPPKYIKGFIQITTPSGFAKRFKSFRSSSRFLSEVWKEALKIAKQ